MRILLDTSAWRGERSSLLEATRRRVPLHASPYSFWEIASHLDEGDFNRAKGLVMKFQHAEILDDPWAAVIPHDDRVPDDDLIYAFMAALRSSNSSEELSRCTIRGSDGNLRQIEGMPARLRETLEKKEAGYVGYASGILKMIQSGEVALETTKDRFRAISDISYAFRAHAAGRPVSVGDASIEDQTFIYSMYLVFRSWRAHSGGRQPVRNDYEDACILLQLDRSNPWTLVTADREMAEALGAGVAEWKANESDLPPCRFVVSDRVARSAA